MRGTYQARTWLVGEAAMREPALVAELAALP